MSHEKGLSIEKIDKNMQLEDIDYDKYSGLKWYSPMGRPFRLAGFAWIESDRVYRRLPVNPKYPIRDEVDRLANATAGGQVHFMTDSAKVAIKVKLAGPSSPARLMTPVAQCGFDCYIGKPGQKIFRSIARFDAGAEEYQCFMAEDKNREMRNITLNFPLSQGVKELQIGIEDDAELLPPPPYDSDKKVIFYGTSITQGGCASRPGMAYTNILSRRFNYEFINLGFSGNGQGEPELAEIISEIENPACLVLDYEANSLGYERMSRTLPEFIRIYRKHHPSVKILVVSKIRYALDLPNKEWVEDYFRMRDMQREVVESFRNKGDMNIYFCDGSNFLGDDFHECSVDGAHPTDLGFWRIAEALTPVLEKLLKM